MESWIINYTLNIDRHQLTFPFKRLQNKLSEFN